MKLLIVTQTLDSKHSVLGFFVRWVLEFSKQCEEVTVFCLDKGEDMFPSNVNVIHVPRNWKGIKTWPLVLAYKAFVYRKKYRHVFVHMNPEYVLSAGLVWKILRKKISLWYAHGTVSLRLKIATAFCNSIFSSTPEGFRYKTSKLHIVGQGIDISLYNNVNTERDLQKPLSLVSIGRISPSKRLELLLETIFILKSEYKIDAVCTVIGGPITSTDQLYLRDLHTYVNEHDLQKNIIWKGSLPLINAIDVLKQTDIFVHFGNTGSLDKSVLDAMMCGVIPLSTNEAVQKELSGILGVFLHTQNPQDVTREISKLISLNRDEISQFRKEIKTYVEQNFLLENFIKRIIERKACL